MGIEQQSGGNDKKCRRAPIHGCIPIQHTVLLMCMYAKDKFFERFVVTFRAFEY